MSSPVGTQTLVAIEKLPRNLALLPGMWRSPSRNRETRETTRRQTTNPNLLARLCQQRERPPGKPREGKTPGTQPGKESTFRDRGDHGTDRGEDIGV